MISWILPAPRLNAITEAGRLDELGWRFCCGHRQLLAAAAGTNDQERLLILYCWIFNHPIDLTCDKGSLDALCENISACNPQHRSAVTGMGVYMGRWHKGDMRRSGDGREEGMFNVLIPLQPTLVTLALCKGGQMERARWEKNTQKTLPITFSLNFLDGALSRAASLGLPASVLPFPQFVARSQGDLCSLLASTLQTGETSGSGTEWGEVERLTDLGWLV